MLKTSKNDLESWRTTLVKGWYDYKSPAVNQDLITLWIDLLDDLEARFPDCVIWLAPASDSSIGLDFHKLIDRKWSKQFATVHTYDTKTMSLYSGITDDDDREVPFDKEVMFKFLEEFRANVKN